MNTATTAAGDAAASNPTLLPAGAGRGGYLGSITQSEPLDLEKKVNRASYLMGGLMGVLIGLLPAVTGHETVSFGVALVLVATVAWLLKFRVLIATALIATALQLMDIFGALSPLALFGEQQSSTEFSVALIVGIWAVVGIRAADRKLKEAERARMMDLIRKDFLTDAGNQRAFWESLVKSIAFSKRSGTPLSLILLDMDNFKQVNDRYGHQSGDLVLKAVAEVLRRSCRDMDQLFRYGGDEFSIICPDTRISGAEELSWRLVESINEMPTGFPNISACIGVAELRHSQNGSELLDAADRALMKIKREGHSGSVGIAASDEALQSRSLTSSEFNAQQAALQLAMASLSSDHEVDPGHSESVERLAVLVAGRLGVRGDEYEQLRLAARVHDVGSYVIPESIREKAGPLTDEEWKKVRAHVEAGERIVRSIPQLAPTAGLVRHTHERWDGDGYPDGLDGDTIPLGSRIIAVCDTFQALRHDRPYRIKLTTNEALDELKNCSGTQFDPQTVEALIEVVSDNRPHGGNISLTTGTNK